MAGKLHLFVGLFAVATLIALGDALECYDCSYVTYDASDAFTQLLLDGSVTNNNENCKDGNLGTSDVDVCESFENGCGKFVLDLELNMFGISVKSKTWARGCYEEDEEYGCTEDFDAIMLEMGMNTLNPSGDATACGCDTDLCNAAPALASVSALLLASLLSALMLQ